MELKKLFKIIGFVLLTFIILLVGLIIVASLNKSAGVTLSEQSAYGGTGMAERNYNAPSSKSSMSLMQTPANLDLATESGPTVPGQTTSVSVDKKIIKTGNLSLKVEKADKAAEAITNIAKANQGDVYSSNFSQSSRGTKSGYITLRVPAANFEITFSQIKKVATQVLSESTNAQDITAEYIDLEARLKNKQAEEQSFLDLLKRSGKMEEILAVTQEVARVRGEIEQLAGQKRYLDSQTEMSTIMVNLAEDVEITPVSEDWRPWQVIKTSVKQLIIYSQNLIDSLIRFVVIVLPILFIYVLIIWLIYFLGKKLYRHFKKPIQ